MKSTDHPTALNRWGRPPAAGPSWASAGAQDHDRYRSVPRTPSLPLRHSPPGQQNGTADRTQFFVRSS